ncbi:MAG: LptF/LptG family permease [Chlorobi bacterium]|nr:LptF/LptG family permease [Chlorobiota bacterium]
MIIDRYILKQFANTFFFAILAFLIIYITVDLIENLDNFFDHNAGINIIFKYYLNYIPDIIHLVIPISVLIAGLFTIGKLDSTHELTAIRAGGRSIPRIVLPVLLFSLILSFVMTYFNGWLVPLTNKQRFTIDREYLGRNMLGTQTNISMRVSANTSIIFESFNPNQNIGRNVSVEKFKNVNLNLFDPKVKYNPLLIVERIDADEIKYDSLKKSWILINGVSRNLSDPLKIYSTSFSEKLIPFLKVEPSKLDLSQYKETELTLTELNERIENEKSGGRDVIKLLVEYYSRISFSFAPFIVAFFGIPFSSNQRKSGAAMQIGIGALISAMFLVFSEVTKALCYSGVLIPIIGAWITKLFFLSIGLFNLFRIERN